MSVAYLLKECINYYYHGVDVFEKLKSQSCNAQKRRSFGISNCLFETYKSYVFTHGKNILKIASDMDMKIMCEYPKSKYA